MKRVRFVFTLILYCLRWWPSTSLPLRYGCSWDHILLLIFTVSVWNNDTIAVVWSFDSEIVNYRLESAGHCTDSRSHSSIISTRCHKQLERFVQSDIFFAWVPDVSFCKQSVSCLQLCTPLLLFFLLPNPLIPFSESKTVPLVQIFSCIQTNPKLSLESNPFFLSPHQSKPFSFNPSLFLKSAHFFPIQTSS